MLSLFLFSIVLSPHLAQDCSADDDNFLVPIAVGAALAGVLILVLLAYFIGQGFPQGEQRQVGGMRMEEGMKDRQKAQTDSQQYRHPSGVWFQEPLRTRIYDAQVLYIKWCSICI